MSEISLTANVYFVGPVTPVRDEGATTFYFPCVAYHEYEQDGEDLYNLTDCWFIAHEGFTQVSLSRLKWGDRLKIAADIGECGLAQERFQERYGWHVTSIDLVSRDNATFEGTDIPIPLCIDLPPAPIAVTDEGSASMRQ